MNIPRKALGALGVGALVAGTWFTGPTLAQSDDGESDATAEHVDGPRGEHRGAFKEALAEELGISVEELEAAMEAARASVREDFIERCEERRDEVRDNLVDRLRDRIDDGELTEEQAREILDRFDERDCEDGPPHRNGDRRGPRFRDGFGPRSGGGTDRPDDIGPPVTGVNDLV